MQLKISHKIVFASIFSLLTLIIVLQLIMPFYNGMTSRLENFCENLLVNIEEKTSISISYKNISPSILFDIVIRDVKAYDSNSGDILLDMDKVVVDHSLSKVFSGNLDKVIQSVKLGNVNINFDVAKNNVFYKKILSIFSNNNDNLEINNSSSKNIKDVNINLPFDIYVKKLNGNFSFEDFSIQTEINKFSLNPDVVSSSLKINTLINVSYVPKKEKMNFGQITTGKFSLKGKVPKNIKDSLVQLKVISLENSLFSIVPLHFILTFDDENNMDLRLFQNIQNMALKLKYDVTNSNFDFKLQSNNFDPMKIVKLKDKTSPLKNLEGSKITGEVLALGQVNDFNLKYDGKLNVVLPEKLISGNFNINTIFNGNKNNININKLSINSDFMSGNYEGSFYIPKLQPQGVFVLDNFTLDNGNSFFTEVYFDPLEKGFMIFIPQIAFGEQYFSAIQSEIIPNDNSIDFSLDVYDYTHLFTDEPGKISIGGSLLLEEKKYLQTQLEIQGFAIDAFTTTGIFFANNELASTLSSLKQTLLPFVMTTEIYFSSDFSELVYNVPYMIMANTAKDREFALLSFDGNESSINVTNFDVLFAGQNLTANLTADFSSGYRDIIFSSIVSLNSISYDLSGLIIDLKDVSVTGSYGLDFIASIKDFSNIHGTLNFENFPLALNKYIFAFSAETDFNFNALDNWNLRFNRLDISEPSGIFKKNPRIYMAGNINNYGAMFENVSVSNTVATLDGDGSVSWFINDGILNNVGLNVQLNNVFSDENYKIKIDANNPRELSFSQEDFLSSLVFDANIDVNKMSSSRFLSKQNSENYIDANITALGSLYNPAIYANVTKASLFVNDTNLNLVGNFALEDGLISGNNFSLNYGNMNVHSDNINFDLKRMLGNLGLSFTNISEKDNTNIKLDLSFLSQNELKEISDWNLFKISVPESFELKLNVGAIKSSYFGDYEPFSITLLKTPGRYDVFGGNKNQLYGYYNNANEIFINMDKSLPVSLMAKGIVAKEGLNVDINNINVNTEFFAPFVKLPEFKMISGMVTGNLKIEGVPQDPEFNGDLLAKDFTFTVPAYIAENVYASEIPIKAEKNLIYFEDAILNTTTFEESVKGSVKFALDRWSFDFLDISIDTINKRYIKAKTKIDFMEFAGNAQAHLDIFLKSNSVKVSGLIFAENTDGIIAPKFSAAPSSVNFQTVLDLRFVIGPRSQVYIPTKRNPIMRGLVAPETEITLLMDTDANLFDLKGDLVLRGGEVSYGNRGFYIREGRLVLNESAGTFDPTITVRAETREKDEDGQSIRIILSALNQHFSDFTPMFTSSPAKSEQEIMEILALSFTENLDNFNDAVPTLLAMGGEMVVQMTLFRQIENGLRDFFNFDIMSLRTNILKNAMTGLIEDSNNYNMNFGNFIDNTSVYIGKYIGNSLYADFLGHFDYNENEVGTKFSDGLTFKPEIGFEVSSPFANIRWSMIPDFSEVFDTNEMDSLMKSLVGDTSISLSWKLQL